ncbi:hypothetical protein PHYSODRAFT_561025 [Phytophthora sojae]|uniref:Uncharacterized protein n=1 Tax=Phytophthora sojae (strain P6497) TaxID=1094619 RepID=G4ZLR0_PHYSP|nr:hypothetical protein PHYSODRAFT_561025 [Phytophthora sojae]EGZ14953.1 hypothetical protein PHYSODRAFT_561025 [Phytophthora sojae]|eukprot:XP_009528702.1 hypothetical protein PHYSODRAFT_561025 [Phytophthora sojae]
MVSDGFITSSESLLEHQTSFIYGFDNPESTASSGALVDADDVCSSTTSGLCIKLRFTGADQLAPIFLRKLQSIHAALSSSIGLPPGSSVAGSTSTYPAPWVLVGAQSLGGDTSWSFFVGGSSSSGNAQSFRLTFEAVNSMQDMTTTTPFTIDLEFVPDDPTVIPIVRRRQFGDLAVVDTTGQPEPAFITSEIPDLIDDGDEVTGITITLDLEQPRLGGLYSGSQLDDVAPTCSECTTLLEDCSSSPECRAFSACMGVLLEADLTLIATMLEKDDIDSSVDATWLLQDCLSPSDGTEWSSTVRELLESSYACLWAKSCPLAYSTTIGRQIVLDYSPGEQILTFDLASGFASVSFELGNWAYSFVEDFTANATEVTAQLDTMLMEMYRTALSNVATVKSALVTTEDSNTGVVTAQLTILYEFLGALPQPYVAENGGSLACNTTEEALHLRVLAIT